MIRFSHTVFALPFALLSAVMAWTLNKHAEPPQPWRWQELLGILLCMVRPAARRWRFNRLADRELDAANPRTRDAASAGRLAHRCGRVRWFAAACCVAFVAATLLFLPNRCRSILSLPVLAFLLAYSYTKRFTALAHFWLGAALMLSPVAAWIAIRGEVLEPTGCCRHRAGRRGAAWVAGLRHHLRLPGLRRSTLRLGLHSVPARLGVARALAAGRGLPSGDDRAAGRAAAGVSAASAGSTGRASRPSRRCWCTSTRWCGPTT